MNVITLEDTNEAVPLNGMDRSVSPVDLRRVNNTE